MPKQQIPPPLPKWTDQHQDAHDAMVTMGVPKKEARKLLEGLPAGQAGDLMRQALRARTGAQRPAQPIPGAPSGAVPLNPPAKPSPPPTPTPSGPPPIAAPPQKQPSGPAAGTTQKKKDTFNRIADALTGWMAPSWVGGGPTPSKLPPKAPIGPALAQTQPEPPAQPPAEKPRIRVPLVSRQIPPAPIAPPSKPEPEGLSDEEREQLVGGLRKLTIPEAEARELAAKATSTDPFEVAGQRGQQAAEAGKPAGLPLISSAQEYQQLAPGTEFIWKEDGHVYEKPAK